MPGVTENSALPKILSESDREWFLRAKTSQHAFYMSFGDTIWQDMGCDPHKKLLLIKICYAIFGGAVKADAKTILTSYSEEQMKAASGIRDQLLNEFEKITAKRFLWRIIFICYKKEKDNKELITPVFVLNAGEGEENDQLFVDVQCRVYKNFMDWVNDNKLPKAVYVGPSKGRYSCLRDGIEFDPEKKAFATCGKTPACNHSFLDFLDTASSIILDVEHALFFVAPALATAIAAPLFIVGASAYAYKGLRSIFKLSDGRNHNEPLTKPEEWICWLKIIASPLEAPNRVLDKGASEILHIMTNIVKHAKSDNTSPLTVMNLTNLMHKNNEKSLTDAEVLHSALSIYFYTNTFIQPVVLREIMKEIHRRSNIRDTSVLESGEDKYSRFKKESEAKKTREASNRHRTHTTKLFREVKTVEDFFD